MYLTFLLIGLAVSLALNFAAVWRQYRGPRVQGLGPRASRFQPGDVVITTRELNWSHGSGTVVPAGEELHLKHMAHTTSGIRWAGHWYHENEPVYVNSVPEDAIASCQPSAVSSQPVPSLKAQPVETVEISNHPELCGNGESWFWEVRSQFTNALYEWGTEPTELAARKMAFAAYDRVSMEESTPLAEREPQPLTTLAKFEKGQPGFKERLRSQLRSKYRPQLVDRLFQLLETPIAELSANDRRIINDLFTSLCIIGTVDGLNRNRTSGPIRSADSGSHLSSLTSQPSSAG